MESLILQIKRSNSLTKTEQTIANFIIEHPQEVIASSVQELALQVPTSAASIVRFSQKFCGSGGFSQLKLKLSAESTTETNLYQELSPDDTLDDLKKKLAFRIEQSVQATGNNLTTEQLNPIIDVIGHSDQILAYGVGASKLAALDLQQKFIRIGKSVSVLDSPHLISTTILTQPSNTVLVLFSNSGLTDEVIDLAILGKKNSMPIVAITSNAQNPLSKIANFVLTTDSTNENIDLRSAATTSLISQLFVLDLLYYQYFSLDYDNNIKNIKTTQQYVKNNFREE